MNSLAVLVGIPFLAISLALGGRAVLRAVVDWDDATCLAAGAGLAVAVLATLEIGLFLTGLPQAPVAALGLLGLGALAGWGLARFGRPEGFAGSLLLLWGLGLVHLSAIQLLVPIFAGGGWYGDWYMHQVFAHVFLGLEDVGVEWAGYTLASRTPLYNAACAAIQAVFGTSYPVFQAASTAISWTFVLPLAVLARRVASERVARLVVLGMGLNLWMLHMAWYSWSKLLCATFVLIALMLAVQGMERIERGEGVGTRVGAVVLSLTLAFLTHQLAAAYALVLGVAVLARTRSRGLITPVAPVALGVGTACLLGAVWYGFLARTFGLGQALTATPATTAPGGQASTLDPMTRIADTAFNTVATMVPLDLLFAAATGGLGPRQLPWLLSIWALCLATGAYGVVGLAVLIRGRADPATPSVRLLWAVGLGGGLLATTLHPGRAAQGMGHAVFFVGVALLAVALWSALVRETAWKAWCVALLAEFGLLFWGYQAVLWTDVSLVDPVLGNAETVRVYSVRFLSDLSVLAPGIGAVVALVAQGVSAAWIWRELGDPPTDR